MRLDRSALPRASPPAMPPSRLTLPWERERVCRACVLARARPAHACMHASVHTCKCMRTQVPTCTYASTRTHTLARPKSKHSRVGVSRERVTLLGKRGEVEGCHSQKQGGQSDRWQVRRQRDAGATPRTHDNWMAVLDCSHAREWAGNSTKAGHAKAGSHSAPSLRDLKDCSVL